MTVLEQVLQLRGALDNLTWNATDSVASTAVAAYPKLCGKGNLIPAGSRINWKGRLKRAAADLWDNPGNDPDSAPMLWEDIAYREGYRVIPQVITPGTAFVLGGCGWWGDTLYRSLIAANVYTPEQYPQGWEKVER